MRKRLLLLLALPLLLGTPSASAQSTPCTIDPQDGPVTGQVGTEFTFFITVTGCASSNNGLHRRRHWRSSMDAAPCT